MEKFIKEVEETATAKAYANDSDENGCISECHVNNWKIWVANYEYNWDKMYSSAMHILQEYGLGEVIRLLDLIDRNAGRYVAEKKTDAVMVKVIESPLAKNYPSDLPPISVGYNRICLACSSVWLDPCAPDQPDFNHCPPMLDTAEAFHNLTSEQKDRFDLLVEKGVLCPFYSPKK